MTVCIGYEMDHTM